MNSAQAQIKLYPGPGRAALAAGEETMLRFWLLCRCLTADTNDGCGWEERADVLSALKSIGLSQAAWYRAIKDPSAPDYFTYDKPRERLYLRSLESVCRHYNCIPGRPVYVPLKQLHRMQTFRAAIHAAQYDVKGQRIGRETVAEKSGVSAASQWRYEKMAGIEVERNYIYAPIDHIGDLPIPESLTDRRNTGYITEIDGRKVILWQTVNTYHNSNRNNAPVGMARRVARKLRSPVVYGDGERRQPYFVERLASAGVRGVVAVRDRWINLHLGTIRGVLWQHLEVVRN